MAHREEEFDAFDQAMFDQDVDTMFDTLFDNAERGEIGLDQVEEFFPDEVKQRNV